MMDHGFQTTEVRSSASARGTARPSRRLWRFTGGAIVGCAILATLVQLRRLGGLDLAFTLAIQRLADPPLDRLSDILSLLFSSEGTAVIAVVMSYGLWRRGIERWSLLPFAFAVPVVVELVLRFFIHQPLIPPQLYREGSYPLLNPSLPGSFPSGHAIRSSFVCTLGIVLLAGQRDLGRALRWFLVALFIFAAFSRVYLGTHWLSDVIAGTLLGTTAGLWTAHEIGHQLRNRTSGSN